MADSNLIGMLKVLLGIDPGVGPLQTPATPAVPARAAPAASPAQSGFGAGSPSVSSLIRGRKEYSQYAADEMADGRMPMTEMEWVRALQQPAQQY